MCLGITLTSVRSALRNQICAAAANAGCNWRSPGVSLLPLARCRSQRGPSAVPARSQRGPWHPPAVPHVSPTESAPPLPSPSPAVTGARRGARAHQPFTAGRPRPQLLGSGTWENRTGGGRTSCPSGRHLPPPLSSPLPSAPAHLCPSAARRCEGQPVHPIPACTMEETESVPRRLLPAARHGG